MLWPGQAGAQMSKLRPVSPTFLVFYPFILLEFRYGLQARPGQGHTMAPSQPPPPNQVQQLLRGTDNIWKPLRVSRAIK